MDVAYFDQPFKMGRNFGTMMMISAAFRPWTTTRMQWGKSSSPRGPSGTIDQVCPLTSFVNIFGFSRRKQLNKRMTSVSCVLQLTKWRAAIGPSFGYTYGVGLLWDISCLCFQMVSDRLDQNVHRQLNLILNKFKKGN